MPLKKYQGYTLIELVMVLILMSLLAVSVFIAWPTSVNLSLQANQIANDVRYTQALSMTSGQRYRLVIVSSTTYQIVNSAGTPITMAMGTTTVTLASGITFGTLTNLPNSLIAFDGKGTPYTDTGSPGTALASTAVMTLNYSGASQTVSIQPQTGSASVP